LSWRALMEKGELGRQKISLKVLDRITFTREGARQLKGYQDRRLVEFETNLPKLGFARGEIGEVVNVVDGKVELVMDGGEVRRFDPSRLPRNLKSDAVTIYEQKQISLHEGDRIRWTAKDAERGLFKNEIAHVERIENGGIMMRAGDGQLHTLHGEDPMRHRLDLAYAINVHIAQGITAKSGIVMMSAREKMLNSAQSFLVAVTRIAENIHLVIDDPNKVEQQIERNPGGKTSAREVEKAPAKSPKKDAVVEKVPEDRSYDWGMEM
jgi:ATP-dependent exoDNAse (exonuclease V) alpha subunit